MEQPFLADRGADGCGHSFPKNHGLQGDNRLTPRPQSATLRRVARVTGGACHSRDGRDPAEMEPKKAASR